MKSNGCFLQADTLWSSLPGFTLKSCLQAKSLPRFHVIFLLLTIGCLRATADTDFIFVNGGYSLDSNFSTHEGDAEAFLAQFNAASHFRYVLNANGRTARVLDVEEDNGLRRDRAGIVQLAPTRLRDRITKSATVNNFSRLFSHLSKLQKKSDVTIVYGGHGDVHGPALWGEESLSREAIQVNYAKIDRGRLIRAVHLHCYGGVAIKGNLDFWKEKNLAIYKVQDALEREYHENRCAVSLSRDDELGCYFGFSRSRWNEFFEVYPELTLSHFKEYFTNKHDVMFSSPVLTSDYFIDDFLSYFLADQKRISKYWDIKINTLEGMDKLNRIDRLLVRLAQRKKVFWGRSEQLRNADILVNEASRLKSYWVEQFLALRESDFGKDLDRSILKLSLQSGYVDHFNAYVDEHVNMKWLAEHQDHYPKLFAHYTRNSREVFSINSLNEIGKIYDENQLKRKEFFSSYDEIKKELFDLLTEAEQLRWAKTRFENLKRCENSILNQ